MGPNSLCRTSRALLQLCVRRNSNAFATGPMDLRFCAVLQQDIGDSQPIKQLPYCPPLLARDAEDDISDEMLQTGITMPSTSPRSSPVSWWRRKTVRTDFAWLPPLKCGHEKGRFPSRWREERSWQPPWSKVLCYHWLGVRLLATRNDW